MTEGSIACKDRKKKQLLYLYQSAEDKKKQRHFAMASFCQGSALHYNGCEAFKKAVCIYFINKDVYFCFRFRFSCSIMLTNKAISFLTKDYIGKYWAFIQGLLCRVTVQTFS